MPGAGFPRPAPDCHFLDKCLYGCINAICVQTILRNQSACGTGLAEDILHAKLLHGSRKLLGETVTYCAAKAADWRTRTNLEVDFIVDDEVAIEAKTTRSAAKDDLKGLRAIAEEGAFRHRILVTDEPRPREVDGIAILPWRNFIDHLWTGKLF